jgi:ABC-type branched-subunit amino acid transport system substrate-binding protein
MRRAAASVGATIVLEEEVPFGKEDGIPSMVAKLKSANADLIFWAGGQSGTTVFTKKLQEQGLDVPIICSAYELEEVLQKGLVTKTMQSPWLVFRTHFDTEFTRKFRDAYGETPGLRSDNGYDALMIMMEAIQNTDGSGDAIAAYLRDGKVKYRGYSNSTFDFDENGDITTGEWFLEEVK